MTEFCQLVKIAFVGRLVADDRVLSTCQIAFEGGLVAGGKASHQLESHFSCEGWW